MSFHCLLVPVGRLRCDWLLEPFCCYCSVRCSLVSPCLEGWLGDGAWEGCVPEGREWAMGTPPGTMPSNAPGMPPGATPTTPGGYLRGGQGERLVSQKICESKRGEEGLTGGIAHTSWRILWVNLTQYNTHNTGSFSPKETTQETCKKCYAAFQVVLLLVGLGKGLQMFNKKSWYRESQKSNCNICRKWNVKHYMS